MTAARSRLDDAFAPGRRPARQPSPEELAELQRSADRIGRAISSFWVAALDSREGRCAIYVLLRDAGATMFGAEPAVAVTSSGAVNEPATWYALGRRDFALSFKTYLETISPELVIQMMRENDARYAAASAPREMNDDN